jgi:hypothetical protein
MPDIMQLHTEDFSIRFMSDIVKVHPEKIDGEIHYFISLPSKTVEIFNRLGSHSIPYWHERHKGKSLMAFQLGKKIENYLDKLDK